jgi:AraC-like DNA-binding protein
MAGPCRQLVVPDGCMDLLWSDWTGRIEVAGPDTGPYHGAVPAGGRVAAVRFRPGMATPAVGVPADALRNSRVELAEFWGAEAAALAEQLAAAPDPARALAGHIAARIRAGGTPADPAAPAIVAALSEVPVRAAAVTLGLSERQLRRRSIAAFGYGPKMLQRVLRFQRALRLARAGVPLADVAHTTGYTDQAHLSHEVRDLAGVPLTELC